MPTATNQIGYPLSGAGSISAGVDFILQKEFSSQLVYGYGMFIPNAKINNSNNYGSVAANFQVLVFQITYKL